MNAGRYFAAVAGSSDLVLESIADDEFVGITTEIPEMKKKIRPASARPNKPEAATQDQAFNVPIGMSFSSGVESGRRLLTAVAR